MKNCGPACAADAAAKKAAVSVSLSFMVSPAIVTGVRKVYSIAFAVFALAGCVSVSSTADFYLAETTEVFPPKPKDAPIPILGSSPKQPYKVIGRLAFRSDLGWKFMRESMLYNARANGADAVILRSSDSRQQERFMQVPPRTDWVAVPGPVFVEKKKNKTYYQTAPSYIPVFRPGYVERFVDTIIGIDSEMIVFKR
jgi:hypothetical protein